MGLLPDAYCNNGVIYDVKSFLDPMVVDGRL
jgi:hypothetical protein